jgi:hypothetical protein
MCQLVHHHDGGAMFLQATFPLGFLNHTRQNFQKISLTQWSNKHTHEQWCNKKKRIDTVFTFMLFGGCSELEPFHSNDSSFVIPSNPSYISDDT